MKNRDLDNMSLIRGIIEGEVMLKRHSFANN